MLPPNFWNPVVSSSPIGLPRQDSESDPDRSQSHTGPACPQAAPSPLPLCVVAWTRLLAWVSVWEAEGIFFSLL